MNIESKSEAKAETGICSYFTWCVQALPITLLQLFAPVAFGQRQRNNNRKQ
jgi:hypothetical protein